MPLVTNRRTIEEKNSEKSQLNSTIARKSAEINKDAIEDLNAEEEYIPAPFVARAM